MTTEDVDLTEGIETERRRPGPVCAVGRILSDPARPRMAASLRAMLGVETYAAVSRRLRAAGEPIGPDMLSRHVNGMCSCLARGIS